MNFKLRVYLPLFFLFFLCHSITLGQIDNEAQLYIRKSDSLFKNKEYSKALSFYDKAIDAYKVENRFMDYSRLLISKYRILAFTNNYYDGIQELEAYIHQEDSLDKYPIIKAKAYTNLGYYYSIIGDRGRETECNFKAYSLVKQTDDVYFLGILTNNIGDVYLESGNYNEAIKYFSESLAYFQEKDSSDICVVYYNIAETYRLKKEYDNSVKNYYLSIQLTNTTSNSNLVDVAIGLSKVFTILQKQDSVEKYSELALVTSESISISSQEYVKALLNYNQKEPTLNSIELVKKAYKISKNQGYLIEQINAAKYIHSWYEKGNELDSAYCYFKIYSQLKDSVNQIESEKLIFKQENESKLDSLNTVTLLISKERDHFEKESIQKNKIAVLSIVLSVCLLVMIFLGYKTYKNKKEIYELELLQKQNTIKKRNKELVGVNLELVEKDEAIKKLNNSVKEKLSRSHTTEYNELNSFLKESKNILNESDKRKYVTDLIKLDSEFYKRLKEDFSNLTEDELRLALLIKLNLSSDELINIFSISKTSLNTKRYRLRKKLNLPKGVKLDHFIHNFS